MSGTKFWEANEKFLARREYGARDPVKTEGNAPMNIRLLALALLEVDIEDIPPDDSRQTFAVGLMYGNSLIVANKGVKNGLKYGPSARRLVKASEARYPRHIPKAWRPGCTPKWPSCKISSPASKIQKARYGCLATCCKSFASANRCAPTAPDGRTNIAFHICR
jgi:hypothetical protein